MPCFWYCICRLRQELKNLHKSALLKSNGISVQLPSDSNIHLWNASILAPRRSLYEGIRI